MIIDLAVIGGTAVKAAASSAAGKLAALAVEKGKGKFFPGEFERAVVAGIAAAKADDDACPPAQHLFFRCYENDRDNLLAKVIDHPVTLTELRKPLEGEGNIEVDCLVKVFEQVAAELRLELVVGSLDRWVKRFAEMYRERTIACIQFQVAKEQYLKQLAQRVDDVKFVGIAVPGEEVEKQEVLAQIFVMPDVREERSNSIGRTFDNVVIGRISIGSITMKINGMPDVVIDGMSILNRVNDDRSLLEEQREWAMRDRSSPRIAAHKVLNQSKNKAVLLGAPGSGKTTLASYFALMLTGKNDPTQIGFDANEDWLPVVVRIRDWVLQPGMGLLEYLRSYAEKSLAVKGLPVGFFEHWLDRGKALILLDGLDEVVDEAQRRKVAEEIETFLHRYQDNPAVITSRPAGYRWDFFNLDEFPHYTLEPFDEKQRDAFIEHWYDSRVPNDKAKADRLKADLRKAFKGNDRIQKLAENPLLLTIIALIHRYQAELPRQRFKLYEKAVETLLTSWDSGKELKLYEVLQYLKADDLLYVLKKLAYWIHAQGNAGDADGGTLIDKDELIQQLCKEIRNLRGCKQHEAKQEAERFVDFIQRRTGLLNEQGRGRYAFVHKTFQEYLTAEEICDRFEEGEDEVILDHIRDHLHDAHWREVLLLLVSKLKKKRAAKAIEAVLNAGSEYEKWLHRDLLFAGWCLTEDPADLKTAAPKLVGEILDRLVAIEIGDAKRIGKKVQDQVTSILSRLGGTTLETDAWEKILLQSNTINRFRLFEYQSLFGQEIEVIETLSTLLQDGDVNVRIHSAESLINLDNSSQEVVNTLLEAILYENQFPIHIIANVLYQTTFQQSDQKTEEIINSLLELLNNSCSIVRSRASFTLGIFRCKSNTVINAALSLLQEQDCTTRFNATKALWLSHSSEPAVIEALLILLDDNDAGTRSAAAQACENLNHNSGEIIDKLLHALEDISPNVRYRAISSLRILGNKSGEFMNLLFGLLNDDISDIRHDAATTLMEMGNTSLPVVNTLMEMFNDNTDKVGFRIIDILGRIDKKLLPIQPQLVQWIDRQPDDVPIGAAIDGLRSMIE